MSHKLELTGNLSVREEFNVTNDQVVLLGILFVLYVNGGISLTQLLLLLALLSTQNCCCGNRRTTTATA